MNKLTRPVSLCTLLLGAALLGGGCVTSGTLEPSLGAARDRQAPDDSLFRALGGHAGIASLSERFIRELAADETTRAFFTRTDIGRFDRLIQEQMCAESGGGCTYTGDDMRTAHAGLGIERRHMNAVVEALMRAMDKEGLPVATQNALLAIHAPKQADILGE